MNVLLNAESLRPPLTGIGNYTFHLLEEFCQGELVDGVHCFNGTRWLEGEEQLSVTAALRMGQSLERDSLGKLAVGNIRKAVAGIPGVYKLYSSVMDGRFERTAKTVRAAVYHETNFILKPFPGPCVTTVHDLSHVRYPQFHPTHVVERLEKLLPITLDRADFVITVSNAVRDELIEYFNVPEQRVRTIYHGVDAQYVPRSADETSAVLADFDLKHQGYVLFVATLEPRKGIDVLLDAWSLLPESLRQEFPLVLVGAPGWKNQALLKRIEALGTQGCIRHLGYVPANVLPVLHSGAAVFTYPSLYEGFGMPVLDSMSSGVPVVCRAGTSMAEFAEDSCVLCEGGDADELAAHLLELLQSREKRTEWAHKGLKQARHFSWGRCAAETADIYHLLS